MYTFGRFLLKIFLEFRTFGRRGIYLQRNIRKTINEVKQLIRIGSIILYTYILCDRRFIFSILRMLQIHNVVLHAVSDVKDVHSRSGFIHQVTCHRIVPINYIACSVYAIQYMFIKFPWDFFFALGISD